MDERSEVTDPSGSACGWRARSSLLATVCLLGACSGGGGGTATTPPVDQGSVLASDRIGPQGGSLVVTTGPHAGVSLQLQPGAVSVPTDFSIRVDAGETELPSLFPVYRFEPSDLDFAADSVAVSVRGAAALFPGGAAPTQLAVFSHASPSADFSVWTFTASNELLHTVSAAPTRLGSFHVADGYLHRLFAQQFAFIDPAVPTRFENVFGVDVTVANGSSQINLGRGSLASFWNSPARDNVLILHGLSGSPLDFRGPNDLIASIDPSVHNIVLAVYPSATGTAANANRLYQEIVQHMQPGFGCTIIGHSLGGLIGRYLLEKSRQDPARPGMTANDPDMSTIVDQLIMIATPNGGSNVAGSLLAAAVPSLPEADQRFLRAGVDLLEGPGSFTAELNASYVDNATIYHNLYGDFGTGTDGIVSVASARALPLQPPDDEMVFQTTHTSLHTDAAFVGVTDWIDTVLRSR